MLINIKLVDKINKEYFTLLFLDAQRIKKTKFNKMIYLHSFH